MNSVLKPFNIPVIVGVGEITDRLHEISQGMEPVELMAEALRRAQSDAGAELLAGVDSLDVVSEYSWPYHDAPSLLSERLGIDPQRRLYGDAGGESPLRFIHEAALRIARGESKVAAIVGAESNYTVNTAAKAGIDLPWSVRDPQAKLMRGADIVDELAVKHGMVSPVNVYPFYENASQADWGQTQGQALRESAELWSRYSSVAANNPYSWINKEYSPSEIATVAPNNRLIAWPYTKYMVANPMVNMGAAVLVTSLGYPLKQLQPELSEVQHRLLYLQALEAARCMEEGVINDAADGDLGAVLGLGYPAWTGGTLSLIDSVGIRLFVARCEYFANQYGERYRPSAWLRARAEHGEQFYSKASVHPCK